MKIGTPWSNQNLRCRFQRLQLHRLKNKIGIMKMKYTGERVVPDKMGVDPINLTLHLNRYVFALPYVVNKNCLDVACGTGYGMQLISMAAKSITGIDNDKKTLKWAKENNYFYNKKVKFIELDLNKTKIKGKYDIIISFETVEHLSFPEKFLNNLKSALSQNGILILSTPINEPPNPFHKHFFTWESLQTLMEQVFDGPMEWYTQNINSIIPGENKKALFAICIIHKSSDLKYKISKFRNGLRKAKWVTVQKLRGLPKSRW